MNNYELHEECLRLLRDGLPDTLDEGLDSLPLSVDKDGDIAVVTFLHRGGDPLSGHLAYIESWTFHLRDGEWMELGGGGGAVPEQPLARRSAAELGGHLRRYGSGRTVRNAGRLLPWGAKFVNHARLRASSDVAAVRIGKRTVDVPPHGHVAVVWGARHAPVLEALAADGTVLDSLDLEHHPAASAAL
ncbi:hypothetical protein [Spirillospora albida]|uniref:hypothetical protein n=1 Tax=Spirillospora albida TaxID=58123 RepID=UPI000A6D3858|nr:hypothetical protein [Spirillospora albida]